MRTRRTSHSLAIALAAVTVAGVALAPTAQAATPHPGLGTLTTVGHTGITVTVPTVAGGRPTSYRVVASTTTSHVTVAYLDGHRADYTGRASGNAVTVAGMRFTASAPYYYRVGVTYAGHSGVTWSLTYSGGFGLAPNPVTGLKAVGGSYLRWTNPSGGSTGAVIEQTSSTGAKVNYTIHQTTPVFTPYGLRKGATYTYRVRALNVAAHSALSSTSASLTGPASYASLRVMSYNLLGAYIVSEGKKGAVAVYAGWKDRVKAAAHLVAQARPDVIGVQEADTILGDPTDQYQSGWHAYPGTKGTPSAKWSGTWPVPKSGCATLHHSDPHYYPYRQADSLCDATNTALRSSTYARAFDAIPQHNGYSDYLIYNKKTLTQPSAETLGVPAADCWSTDGTPLARPIAPYGTNGCGGYWLLDKSMSQPNARFAAWGLFELKATGTKILVIDAHTASEVGTYWDARRTYQVKTLVARAKAKAKQLGATKIVFAGDFNTYVGRAGVADSTTEVMRANGYPDSIENAQHRANTQYMSENFYTRSPAKAPGGKPGYACLDHIYVTPGIGVRFFGEAMNLKNGKFVGTIPSDHNAVYADLYLPT